MIDVYALVKTSIPKSNIVILVVGDLYTLYYPHLLGKNKMEEMSTNILFLKKWNILQSKPGDFELKSYDLEINK